MAGLATDDPQGGEGADAIAPITSADGPAAGLSSAEAMRRLRGDGPNELPVAGGRNILRILREVLTEPMFALLLGAGVIYLLLGDPREASLLLAFASLSITIALLQEARSERVLDALRDLTSPRALVVRDGVRRRIAGREVVRGDVVIVAEGDRVSADARVIEARELQADESPLTGESVPIRKHVAAKPGTAPPSQAGSHLFSGTLVEHGFGRAA